MSGLRRTEYVVNTPTCQGCPASRFCPSCGACSVHGHHSGPHAIAARLAERRNWSEQVAAARATRRERAELERAANEGAPRKKWFR